MKTICGYLKAENEWSSVTSGGLATSIARNFIINGGVVFGVAYTDDFKSARYMKIDKESDVNLIRGTKYIRAEKTLPSGLSLEEEVENTLGTNIAVLCIGLPCEMFHLKGILSKKDISTDNLYILDLVCHGPAYIEIHKAFIDLLEMRYDSKIIDYNVRYKNPYWNPAFIRATFANGKEYVKKLNDSEFGKGFNICPQPCSYSCKFKGDNRASDITIGDFWGITEEDVGYNKYGVSIGFVHTDKADNLLNIPDFELMDADVEKAMRGNPRYSTVLDKNPAADRFLKLFKEKGLEYASTHCFSYKTRIRQLIPNSIKVRIKKLINR